MKRIRISTRVLQSAVFTAFFLGYTACGYYMAQVLHIYHNDAVARTALAFFTSFGRQPHFTAIGFVWQPLPSILQIPFLWVLWPYGLPMMAGPLVTSFLGAVSVILIYRLSFYLTHQYAGWALAIAVLYGLNPMILLYTALGASEIVFMTTLIIFLCSLIKWHIRGRSSDMLIAALAVAVSFGSRYEAIPAFAAGFFLIGITSLVRYKNNWKMTEGVLISYATPFLNAVAVWIGVNWLIMGNPFFFINGDYSNASFTQGIKDNPGLMEHSYQSILKSAEYVFKRVAFLAPALVLLPAVLLPHTDTKRGRDTKTYVALFTPFLMIILFHMYQLYKGDSLGWLRFFIYSIPAVTFIMLYINARVRYLLPLGLALTLVGYVTAVHAMSLDSLGKEENSFMKKLANPAVTLDFSRTFADQKQIAQVMDRTAGNIVIDTNEGFAVPLFAKQPERYAITSDTDFKKVVVDYRTSVQWIIVPHAKRDVLAKNIIYRTHPSLAQNHLDCTTLYKSIYSWNIYRVRACN